MKSVRYPLFLSYCSKNGPDVDLLDLELHRRGVAFFRDRKDLGAGRLTDEQIEAAARSASGFLFYLTEEAAGSEWVRERELELALEEVRRRPEVLLIPIFRDDRRRVVEAMEARTTRPDLLKSFDFSQRHGCLLDPKAIERGRLGDELRRAARTVLSAVMEEAAQHPGGMLRLALVTRQALSGTQGPFDLLMDWTADFPDRRPPATAATCARALQPALDNVRSALQQHLGDRRLHVSLKSHLTPAMALGYRLGRNEGIAVEVYEVNARITWHSPALPGAPLADRFGHEAHSVRSSGGDLTVGINICQPRESFRDATKRSVEELALPAGQFHELYWAEGPGKHALSSLKGAEGNGLAVDLVQRIEALPGYASCRKIHLFNACTPGIAFLLGQQLRNTRPVQTYEWLHGENRYQPSFLLGA